MLDCLHGVQFSTYEKGGVERSIRYIREAFFAAREFAGLHDLNAQARAWCEGPASDRRWPEDGALSVREAFERERASLLALPQHDYPLGERLAVQVGKTPSLRFDLNDYSVPHTPADHGAGRHPRRGHPRRRTAIRASRRRRAGRVGRGAAAAGPSLARPVERLCDLLRGWRDARGRGARWRQ